MEEFIWQVITLIGSELSNFILHIFLVFVITFSIYPTFKQKKEDKVDTVTINRTLIGLFFLLIFQIVLVIMSGLTLIGVVEIGAFTAIVDQLFSALSLVIIVWLWAFPSSSKIADAGIVVISLLLLIMFLFFTFSDIGSSLETLEQSTIYNLAFNFTGLFLSLVGIFLLLIIQPNAGVYGLLMVGLLFLGYLFQFVLPGIDAVYPVFVRLTQVAAFPLLFALSVRGKIDRGEITKISPLTNPVVLDLLRKVSFATDIRDVCSEVAELFSIITEVDYCLIISNENGQVEVYCLYDTNNKTVYSNIVLDASELKEIIKSLNSGKTLNLQKNERADDLKYLSDKLPVKPIKNAVFYPLINLSGTADCGIFLGNRKSRTHWKKEDLYEITGLSTILVQFLQRNYAIEELKGKLTECEEKRRKDSNELDTLSPEKNSQNETGIELRKQNSITKGDFQLILEEIAILKEDNKKLKDELDLTEQFMKTDNMVIDKFEMSERFQEFNKPISTILTNVEKLSDEYFEVMSKKQKKLIKRIGMSAQRLSNLLSDAHVALEQNNVDIRNSFAPFDINEILSELFDSDELQLNKRDIVWKFEESDMPLMISANKSDLIKAFRNLIKVSESCTVDESVIRIESLLIEDKQSNGFASINIFDKQTTLTSDEIANLFLAAHHVDDAEIKENNLLYARSIINSLDGQIWIDSDEESGTVYRMIIPLSNN